MLRCSRALAKRSPIPAHPIQAIQATKVTTAARSKKRIRVVRNHRNLTSGRKAGAWAPASLRGLERNFFLRSRTVGNRLFRATRGAIQRLDGLGVDLGDPVSDAVLVVFARANLAFDQHVGSRLQLRGGFGEFPPRDDVVPLGAFLPFGGVGCFPAALVATERRQ